VVALVGYTNTGKSTLLNTLSKSNVIAKNELFSTLDPTTRRLVLPDKTPFLLTDTVGFIRKLPPALIAAFRATLEELTEAQLLIHVVDINSLNAPVQWDTVEKILEDLNVSFTPRITVLNKIDLLLPVDQLWNESKAQEYIASRCGLPVSNTVLVSAEKKWGLRQLLDMIQQQLKINNLPKSVIAIEDP
jgi:GTP-binding protein HflX